MDPRFKTLRETIYSNDVERRRFRQLVVNSVMATDIVDKELKALRNARWERAFREAPLAGEEAEDYESTINRKATIVIEHLIQASDVAHIMQHWHIYRKWNERFFIECYKAYQDGRAENDPSEGWYKGEIGFFDFYMYVFGFRAIAVSFSTQLKSAFFSPFSPLFCPTLQYPPCQEAQGLRCVWCF